MNERSYLYQIIRYVPDLRRMEPQNIGVLVQGEYGVRLRMWTHFRPLGEKPDFDYANFRNWREFFDQEINGPQIAMFQPLRESPDFLEYLQSRCKGNYILTRPLQVTMEADSLDDVRDYLFENLVRSPEEEPGPSEQPVRSFREQLQAKKLDKHPRLHRDEYVPISGGDSELFRWHYDKNHGSNKRILIDTVQWLGRIRYTQFELEHVLNAAVKVRKAGLSDEFIVVMDEVAPPSELSKDATKRLYENYLRGQETLRQLTDEVVSSVFESELLVNRIEADLENLLRA